MRAEWFPSPWALCAVGALVGHTLIDGLLPLPHLGWWALAVAAACSLIGGSMAGLLLGGRLLPSDPPGGGRALALVLVVLVAAAAVRAPETPPAVLWTAVPGVMWRHLPWLLTIAAAAVPGVAPSLALRDGETLHDARLRRACGYWLSAWGPVFVALVLLAWRGWAGPIFWGLALVLPLAPLLCSLGVRLDEADLHRRGTRLRLAAVSCCASLPLLAAGVLREMTA